MSHIAERFAVLHEIIEAAHLALDRNMWDYISGGTETETTLLRNRLALDSLALRARVLRDVAEVRTEARFLGHKVDLPVFLAPIGGLEAILPDGGKISARAAGRKGVPVFTSSISQVPLEEIGGETRGPKVYQLYVRGDAGWVDDRVGRAIDAGYDAFCVTVDSAHYSRRERDLANRFGKPWRGKAEGMEHQAAFGWRDVERLRHTCSIPLILKGIATPEDAVLAAEAGIEAIVVSNHGGRQLDHGEATMDLLPGIVEAVRGRTSVLVDGGFCRGSDIVKALALGADGVGIGRLYCYALAAAGEEGIIRLLDLLALEIVECLGLVGATSVAGLDPTCVVPARAVAPPSIFGAFPLLRLGRGAG